MSTSVPIHQRPVFLNVEQYADFASVAFYVAGGRIEGTIFLTEIGYWQARLIRYQTLDESRDCLVHSMVEHITDKEREPVAMWIARQIDTALQYPHLTSEERRCIRQLLTLPRRRTASILSHGPRKSGCCRSGWRGPR